MPPFIFLTLASYTVDSIFITHFLKTYKKLKKALENKRRGYSVIPRVQGTFSTVIAVSFNCYSSYF